MALLQVPRGIEAVDSTGAFNKIWTVFFDQLATKINNGSGLRPVVSADAAAALGAYSQSQIQSIVDELNSTKAQLNALLAALSA